MQFGLFYLFSAPLIYVIHVFFVFFGRLFLLSAFAGSPFATFLHSLLFSLIRPFTSTVFCLIPGSFRFIRLARFKWHQLTQALLMVMFLAARKKSSSAVVFAPKSKLSHTIPNQMGSLSCVIPVDAVIIERIWASVVLEATCEHKG